MSTQEKTYQNGHGVNGHIKHSEGVHAGNLLQAGEITHLLTEDGLDAAYNTEAKLGSYTIDDLSCVTVEFPNDPLILLQALLQEHVQRNPTEYRGEITLSGRTLRALSEHGIVLTEVKNEAPEDVDIDEEQIRVEQVFNYAINAEQPHAHRENILFPMFTRITS